MGFFSAKISGHQMPGNAIARAPSPQQTANLHTPGTDAPQDTSEDISSVDGDEPEEKKVYDKEKAVLGGNNDEVENDEEPETETQLNTRLNALLYHTSNESIDLYRLENDSLDLIGRLHYDDFDINDKDSVSRVASYTSLLRLLPTQTITQSLAQSMEHSGTLTPSAARARPLFERGVSFDTLEDSHHMSIIRKVKHPEFKFRRNNKTYLIGFCDDAESLRAVEWVFQELVIHGDTIVVFQVLDEKHHKYVDADLADKVVEKLKQLNTYNRRISLVYEVTIGRPQKVLKQAIEVYKPAMMIVGSHQYGSVQSSTNLNASSRSQLPHHSHLLLFGKTSISKYFLMFALVPVILVKPFYKHQERLLSPIDSDHYFQDMLANIDISRTREKRRKHKFDFLSPTSSRNTSSTNLNGMASEDRGRKSENVVPVSSRDSSISSSRSHSRSQSGNRHSRLSKLFSI